MRKIVSCRNIAGIWKKKLMFELYKNCSLCILMNTSRDHRDRSILAVCKGGCCEDAERS
jgi:hypothetical protein